MAEFVQANEHMYIGIDIGGTSTRIGLFASLAAPDSVPIAKFPTHQRYKEQLQSIVTAIKSCGTEKLAGVGISVAARVAKDGRMVIIAPNLPEYVGEPFAQDLSDHLQCPVRLAHDTVCGLLAEKKFGHLRYCERCAYLTVSTGTGAAIQLRKASTMLMLSIEMGHQILDGNPLQCLCGQVGCLETFTGGKQLELRYGRPVAQIAEGLDEVGRDAVDPQLHELVDRQVLVPQVVHRLDELRGDAVDAHLHELVDVGGGR